jgi:hypothetical protein
MSSVHCGHRRLYEGEMDQVKSISTDQAVSLGVVETRTLLQWICVSQICHMKATWYERSSKYTGRGSEAAVLHILIVDTRRRWVVGFTSSAHLPPGGRESVTGVHCVGSCVGLSVGLDALGGDKNIPPLPGIEPRFFGCPAHSLVTEPTMKAASVPISRNT